MLRPKAFCEPHIALRDIPYECVEALIKEAPFSGGVLEKGRTVWTKESYERKTSPRTTTAFVENIGIISLDPRMLTKTDALKY